MLLKGVHLYKTSSRTRALHSPCLVNMEGVPERTDVRGSEVAWEEVQEALEGWTSLEAYLPESCLRHLRETESAVKTPEPREVSRTEVSVRQLTEPSTSGASLHNTRPPSTRDWLQVRP